jgi:Protein of unknown function (DUF3631)/Domain of unknown function (DUF3854)
MAANGLKPADLEQFVRLGISLELVDAAGVRRVTDAEARDLLSSRHGGDLAGLLFEYRDPVTGRPVTHRLRRDNPEMEDGKPKNKYLSAYGDNRHLYFPPGAGTLLADTSVLVVFVEAEKSCLAIAAAASRAGRPVLAIAPGGCWAWRGRRGKTENENGVRVDDVGPLPDLARVTWQSRDVVILFDSNAATNDKVQAAQRALAAELTKRSANVRIAELPVEDGVNGPDDYLGKHGDAALFAIVDEARPAGAKGTGKNKIAKPKQGHDVQFQDPEPWAEAVDGAAVLDGIAATFTRYLAMPTHAGTLLALWVFHAYTLSAWFTSPILAISSPVKRCGKTLLLIVLGAFAPRRLFAANVTPAALFRTIERYTPTLLIDEADTFIRDNDELRGVLNSGHTRTTAVVIRAVGEDFDPRAFSTWCAKAIALIGRLPDTLSDRAIEIAMRRRSAGEAVERLRQDQIDGACTNARRQAARWADDHLLELQDADPQVPGVLHDRAADCWRPLLAIADCAGGSWPDKARAAAVALSGGSTEEDATTRLLRDIRDIFEAADDPDVLASSVIVERLVAIEERPWREWSRGRPLSAAKLARMLAQYGVHPAGTIRIGDKTAKGYRRAAFTDAWNRYLPPEEVLDPSQRNNPPEIGIEPTISNRHDEAGSDASGSVTNAVNTAQRDAVTLPAGRSGGDDVVDHPDLLWRDPEEREREAEEWRLP